VSEWDRFTLERPRCARTAITRTTPTRARLTATMDRTGLSVGSSLGRGPGFTAGVEAQAIGAVQATTAAGMLARAMLDEKSLGEVPWHADRWPAHAVQWAA